MSRKISVLKLAGADFAPSFVGGRDTLKPGENAVVSIELDGELVHAKYRFRVGHGAGEPIYAEKYLTFPLTSVKWMELADEEDRGNQRDKSSPVAASKRSPKP